MKPGSGLPSLGRNSTRYRVKPSADHGGFRPEESALIRQILSQLADRGDTAIMYGPTLPHAAVLRARTRDKILDPLDARSPCSSPAEELRHGA